MSNEDTFASHSVQVLTNNLHAAVLIRTQRAAAITDRRLQSAGALSDDLVLSSRLGLDGADAHSITIGRKRWWLPSS